MGEHPGYALPSEFGGTAIEFEGHGDGLGRYRQLERNEADVQRWLGTMCTGFRCWTRPSGSRPAALIA